MMIIEEKNSTIREELTNTISIFDQMAIQYRRDIASPDVDYFCESHVLSLVDYEEHPNKKVYYNYGKRDWKNSSLYDLFYMIMYTGIYPYFERDTGIYDQITVRSIKEFFNSIYSGIFEKYADEYEDRLCMPYFIHMIEHYFKENSLYQNDVITCMTRSVNTIGSRAQIDRKFGGVITVDYRWYFLHNIIAREIVSAQNVGPIDEVFNVEFDKTMIYLALMSKEVIEPRFLRVYEVMESIQDTKTAFQISENEVFFAVGHEYGHIKNKDLEKELTSEESKERELIADKFSVEYAFGTKSYEKDITKDLFLDSVIIYFLVTEFIEELYLLIHETDPSKYPMVTKDDTHPDFDARIDNIKSSFELTNKSEVMKWYYSKLFSEMKIHSMRRIRNMGKENLKEIVEKTLAGDYYYGEVPMGVF